MGNPIITAKHEEILDEILYLHQFKKVYKRIIDKEEELIDILQEEHDHLVYDPYTNIEEIMSSYRSLEHHKRVLSTTRENLIRLNREIIDLRDLLNSPE